MATSISRGMRVLLAAVLIGVFVPTTHIPAAPTTHYVDISSGDNAFQGTSENPKRTIEGAISIATAGDTIMVLPGTYVHEAEQDFPILLPAGVTLTSSGGSGVTKIQGNGTHSVISIIDPAAGTEVRGFEITNGGTTDGSGIYIKRNSGGMLSGWPVIAENEIHHNGGGGIDGGGIYIEGVSGAVCAPLVDGNSIHDNTAGDTAGIAAVDYANPVITDNSIYQNTSSGTGGIAVVGTSDATIQDNSISMNTGRGIYVSLNELAVVEIVGNSIAINQTGYSGGGLYLSSSDYVLTGNRIQYNTAGGEGGGVYITNAGVTLWNNEIRSNTAEDDGGAAFVEQGAINANGNTVYGNVSNSGWAGLYAYGGSGSEGAITIRNSILWNHAGQDVCRATIDYCNTENSSPEDDGNTVGAGVIHADPQFMDTAHDFRLESTSPCIDSGHPTESHPSDDFFGTSRPQDGDGNGNSRVDMGFHEYPAPVVDRHSGSDRYDTAVKTVSAWFDSADTAILASGEDFPDALSAAGLAGTHDAPLLLTRRGSLPPAVLTTFRDLGVSEVIIVGGEGAVSATVANALDGEFDVTRIWGANRYATAANVAREVARVEEADDHFNGSVFIARADDFPDALALAPLSYYQGLSDHGFPILLTQSSVLSSETRAVLEDLDVERAYIAGGESAVSSGVKSSIDAILAANEPALWESGRWSGSNRFATAATVADEGISRGLVDNACYVGVATGYNFPDALAGGVAAGTYRPAGNGGGVVVLTETDSLPAATKAMLVTHRSRFLWAEIYGGPNAVSSDVQEEIADALDW